LDHLLKTKPMKKLYILLIALYLLSGAAAQSCLPEGITFTTQEQINSFQINYPNCTEIEGDVNIDGDDITNLNGLSLITSIGGSLNIGDYIGGNPQLFSLTGMDNITSIGGNLSINNNDILTSLTGLDNLIFIGGSLGIGYNDILTSLTGLESLTSVGSGVGISNNSSLKSLTGLENLTSTGGDLSIMLNDDLTSLTGLNNINAGSITNLDIFYNDTLSTCEVQSICYYLASPNGTINIHSNATGCNSEAEVDSACVYLSNGEVTLLPAFSIHPNPTSTTITISTHAKPNKNTFMTIYNISGQALLSRQITEQQTVVDVSWLPQGVYFVRVSNDSAVKVGKFVVQ
jgi:hypothetical protein